MCSGSRCRLDPRGLQLVEPYRYGYRHREPFSGGGTL